MAEVFFRYCSATPCDPKYSLYILPECNVEPEKMAPAIFQGPMLVFGGLFFFICVKVFFLLLGWAENRRFLRLVPRAAGSKLYETPMGKQPYMDFWYNNTWESWMKKKRVTSWESKGTPPMPPPPQEIRPE